MRTLLSRDPHLAGTGAVLVAALLLSTGGVLIKAVEVDAFGINMWRSLLGGATIWAALRPKLTTWRNPATLATAASYAGMLLCLVIATRLTTAANAIFLQFTAPLYVAVLAGMFLHERATPLDLVTLTVTFGGMALFFVGRLETDALTGNLFGLAAGACFGCMLVLFRAPGMGPDERVTAVVVGNLGLAAVLLPVNVVRSEGVFTPGIADAAGLAFMGVAQIGLGYIAMTYGIARIPALEASLVNMVEPVLNPVWVFIFLGENPGGWAILGGAIIVAAVATRILAGERSRMAATPVPAT